MKRPFFSIVIPTKDRPECIGAILKSIKQQTFHDYEVIVSDNANQKPCKQVFEMEASESGLDNRFFYYRNASCLGMCDSFESAIRHANGEWVMMFGDKNILYSNALEKIYSVIADKNPDIVNFAQDYFKPFNVNENMFIGKLKVAKRSGRAEKINPKKALTSHLSCRNLLASMEPSWYAGCIFNGGGYSRQFIERIMSSHISGRVFEGVVPDRYGAVEALCLANEVYFIDDNIDVYGVYGKNTWSSTIKKGYESWLAFPRESRHGVDYTEKLIIPGVISSVKNIVASDYNNACNNSQPSDDRLDGVHIDKEYLAMTVKEELRNIKTIDDKVLSEQRELVEEYISKFNDADMERFDFYCKGNRRHTRRTTAFGLKAMIDGALGRGVLSNSERESKICENLERILSKNSIIIKELDDIIGLNN